MKQHTAVEWLVRKLSTELIGEIPLHRWDEMKEVVQQAKQMEKEQIIAAHTRAYLIGEDTISIEIANERSEQYYNETYKL